jgi:hypothetical protein
MKLVLIWNYFQSVSGGFPEYGFLFDPLAERSENPQSEVNHSTCKKVCSVLFSQVLDSESNSWQEMCRENLNEFISWLFIQAFCAAIVLQSMSLICEGGSMIWYIC